MATATTTTEISAEPAAVWAVLSDPARLPEWVTIHQGYVGEPPATFESGTGYGQRVSIMGMPADISWTVTTVEAPTRSVTTGSGPMGINVANTYALEPSGAATLVTWTMEFSGGMVMAVGGQLESQVSAAQRASFEKLRKIVAG